MRRKVRAARVRVLAVRAAHARVVRGVAVLVVAGKVSRRVKARGSASTRTVTRATHRVSPPITPTRVSARTVRHVLLAVQAVAVRVRAGIAARHLPIVALAVPVAVHAVPVAQVAHRAARAAAIVAPPVAVIAVAELRLVYKKTALRRAVFCGAECRLQI
jgi:hypothetical protein